MNSLNDKSTFDAQNPFKNQSFLIEDEVREEDVFDLKINQRDDHLKDKQTKEDPLLAELNLLADKFNHKNGLKNFTKYCNSAKGLPIEEKQYEIMESIHQNLITIICGSTGCGKSTQIPQYLYQYGMASMGKIGITQPRRIAAVSLSNRVKEEMEEKGEVVGYQVRYLKSKQIGEKQIKFMTDGILLNEMMSDFLLKDYSVIVIDEAHERKMATDILIGLLSKVVKIRAKLALQEYQRENEFSQIKVHPLRLVIMSATLKIDDFVNNPKLVVDPPLVKIQSKTYPVSIFYNKVTPEDYVEEMLKKVRKIHLNLPEGGILVFLTGREEVLEFCKELHNNLKTIRKCKLPSEEQIMNGEIDMENLDAMDEEIREESLICEEADEEEEEERDGEKRHFYESETCVIIPLFSKMQESLQKSIFEDFPLKRKIIVSTNVAETSLTINNLKYVVDCGKEKQKIVNPLSGVMKFEITDITKSSAKQRKGRVGRTNMGYCY